MNAATASRSAGKTRLARLMSIAGAVVLSDRVVVMTDRPGQVKGVVEIAIPRPRDEEMERSEVFLDYTFGLKRLLADGATHGPGDA